MAPSVSPEFSSDVRASRRRRGLIILLALGAAGVAIWALSGRDSAGRETALVNARNGQFGQAEPALRAAYERNRDDVEVVEALARGYSSEDNVTHAEELLTRWVELRPGEIEPLRFRHAYYRKRRDMERSYADAKRLVELDPNNYDFRRTAMNNAFDVANFTDSEVHCRKCLQLRPGDSDLRVMLARILRSKGDNVGSATVLDQLLKEDPKNTQYLLSRGILYLETGVPEKAIPMLREVLDRDPRSQRTAGYQLSLALSQVGRHEEARKVMVEVRRRQDLEVFADTIRNQPDNLDLQVRLAKSLLSDGHDADGENMLRTVLQRDPGFRPAHQALADLYEKRGETTRAAEHRRLAGQP